MANNVVDITNDQVFKRVFGRDNELCRRLIELALEVPISRVEYVEPQHESREVNGPGGAYFDVMATLETGELIDVEMQAHNRPDMLRRARHYLGRLTTEEWREITTERHTYNYNELPNAAVIFVCNFDPLGDGVRRYTGMTVYRGKRNHTGDGAVAVLLNAKGAGDDIEPDLAAFLDYVASGQFTPGECPFVDRVARGVNAVNAEVGMQEGLMKTLDEVLWWTKQEGLEEGRAEGMAMGQAEGRAKGQAEGRAEGRTEGRAEGFAESQRLIAELASRMANDGRASELADVLTDGKRLSAELEHYGIAPVK